MLPGSGARSGPGSTAVSDRIRRRWLLLVAPLLVVVAAVTVTAALAFGGDGEQAVTVRTPDGDVIASLPVEAGDRFAVSYRNSVYTTLAEERYRVLPDGRFELVELAADQVAVLEEYYAVPGAPRPAPPGDRRAYVVEPDPTRPAVFERLNIAATDLGERTLWVPGHPPVPLWQRVVSENPTVLLDIEEI
ncbi:hypothetical protein E4P41_03630 [Geodermatophilus sp. DF01-2]|uniref:hypothetical protein n=1 Tax=Geodermatophilus sp. DF01-2 TaxID=2559610 RepID=UPI001074566D|nr:hypothetical protein [Geodermatophilus sp. DF01_2]TFV63816.1 hypothetical protein E4P41_03630 [Geodermatophilus sp. DF01_2]